MYRRPDRARTEGGEEKETMKAKRTFHIWHYDLADCLAAVIVRAIRTEFPHWKCKRFDNDTRRRVTITVEDAPAKKRSKR